MKKHKKIRKVKGSGGKGLKTLPPPNPIPASVDLSDVDHVRTLSQGMIQTSPHYSEQAYLEGRLFY